MTSMAVAEGIVKTAQSLQDANKVESDQGSSGKSLIWRLRDTGSLLVVAFAFLVAFSFPVRVAVSLAQCQPVDEPVSLAVGIAQRVLRQPRAEHGAEDRGAKRAADEPEHVGARGAHAQHSTRHRPVAAC